MIRGVTKNIAIKPVGYKDLDPIENFVPLQMELYNGFVSDIGNWHKRPGFAQKWDTTVDLPVTLLIPDGSGYAVGGNKVFQLGLSVTELTSMSITLTGNYRPVWLKNKDDVVIVDGGTPVEITPTGLVILPGSPSNFRYLVTVGEYTIGAGHTDRTDSRFEFRWSAAGNYENWTTGDSGDVRVKKTGVIKNLLSNQERLYVYKEDETEIWYNRGGATPFARTGFMKKGLKASYSLVEEADTAYWLGDDLRFYRLEQGKHRLVSPPFEDEIQNLVDPESVYGFNFKKEHLIKWVAPTDGKVFVFDYKNEIWSQDSYWANGQHKRFPMASYMELGNKQYFGSFGYEGLVHEISTDYLDDGGNPINVHRRFSVKFFESGHRGRCNRIGFRFKRGVATSSETAPVFMWRHRLDKGLWSVWDSIDLGAEGVTNPYVERFNDKLGIGRELDIEIMETDAVEFVLTNVDLTVKELGR